MKINTGVHASLWVGMTAIGLIVSPSIVLAELVVVDDRVGVNQATPAADSLVHVFNDGTPDIPAKILVENAVGTAALREMFSLKNNGGSLFSFEDTNLSTKWFFSSSSTAAFNISLQGTGGPEFAISGAGQVRMGPGPIHNFNLLPNGNLTILGTLTQSSDKAKKTAFSEVDATDVLNRVADMPITTWQFRFDEPELRHMGPTAQDFYAAFGLGVSDKTIAPVDGIGVALAAIQSLNSEAKLKQEKIDELSQQSMEQQQALKLVMEQLAAQQAVIGAMQTKFDAFEPKQTTIQVGY